MKLLRSLGHGSDAGSRGVRLAMEAALIGAVSGLSCASVRLLFRLLQWCITAHAGVLPAAADALPLWRRVLTPALGGLAAMAVSLAYRRFGAGSSATEYVEAIRLENGRIGFLSTLCRTLSSAFSVATGAAIGREGSMIQFAAAAVSSLGQRLGWMRMPLPQQVACGVAAAVGAAYQAPIAGVFFAVEIVIGKMEWRSLPVLVLAALMGVTSSRAILGSGPLFATRALIPFSLTHAWIALVLAAFFGLLGPPYLWLIRSLRSARRLPLPLLWSGALVGILSLGSTEVWGNGDVALRNILESSTTVEAILMILALRLCATTFCVGTGTVGGVFTPTLFAGSAFGLLLCHLFHGSDPLLFALIGMGTLLAAATHAPLMASFMGAELTGEWTLLPLMFLCNLIAWRVASGVSRHSLYAIASDVSAALPRADLEPARSELCPQPAAAD